MFTKLELQDSIIIDLIKFTTFENPTLFLSSLLIIWIIYSAFFHPLAKYPGPLLAKFGPPGIWQIIQTYQERYSKALEEAHDRYGTVVRISTNHLSFNNSEAANIIYAHGQSINFPKTSFYQSFQVYKTQPSLFSEIDYQKHQQFRRAIGGAYSMNNVVKLEEFIEPLLTQFVQKLSIQKNPINIAKWVHYAAMDLVGEIAFGEAFGFVESGNDDDKFLEGVSNLSRYGSIAGCMPAISQSIRKILKIIKNEPGGEVVGKITEPLIAKRYQKGNNGRNDMLDSFMKCKHPATKEIFTQKQTLQTAISVVGAGSDTTATAITSILYFIVIDQPKIFKQLQKEIDDAFEIGKLSWPIKYSDAVQLPLLQACIKESLRLWPPISMSLPRKISDDKGSIIQTSNNNDQIHLPKGTIVSISPYVIHRNYKVWGKDARKFNPERWLKGENDEKNFFSFGGGARQCIGKSISLLEISKCIPSLLRAFNFEPPTMKESINPRQTWFNELNLTLNVNRREEIDIPGL